jgi:hypothetical protein
MSKRRQINRLEIEIDMLRETIEKKKLLLLDFVW